MARGKAHPAFKATPLGVRVPYIMIEFLREKRINQSKLYIKYIQDMPEYQAWLEDQKVDDMPAKEMAKNLGVEI